MAHNRSFFERIARKKVNQLLLLTLVKVNQQVTLLKVKVVAQVLIVGSEALWTKKEPVTPPGHAFQAAT